MKLNLNNIENKEFFESSNIKLPNYNVRNLVDATTKNPTWLHFGGGNIFRAFVARSLQSAIEKGFENTGVIVAETFDNEVIEKVYTPFDNLCLSVLMNSTGELEKEVVGSITESIVFNNDTLSRLIEIATNENLKLISFTITEKGYSLKDAKGDFLGVIKEDISNLPKKCKHTMSLVTYLLLERFQSNKKPISIVSMDNCANNGDKVREAVLTIANEWKKNDFVTEEFINYLMDENFVAFPITMIDKITPRPDESVKESLESLGLSDLDIVVTSKNSYVSAFVNAEKPEYLIIEDKFPNGKIDFGSDRIFYTDKEVVKNVETMKVTTCLNPLHTALAVGGCVLGHTLISEEMKDDVLEKLVNKIGYDEGMKVVIDPKIINPKEFIDEVVYERLRNPYIPDTPQRIATDTSQKVNVRFCETIHSYIKDDKLHPSDLVGIPLALALWFRYLMAVNDELEKFELSPDPLMPYLSSIFTKVEIGKEFDLSEILSNEEIFSVDFEKCGLKDKINTYFNEMIQGKSAVRNTLNKYLD